MLFIIPDEEEGWQAKVADFPQNWTVGASDMVSELYDMREIPEIYIIGSDGNIVTKHIGIMKAIDTSLSIIQ
ncbi:MAG: hypothetical protein K2G13_08795 [Muribaculaceae bacterium]|nr:hypothetical protein [Muribaculaceae bacterium]